jgi:intracellular sulfur oxidation DsrE/DsrF family protein
MEESMMKMRHFAKLCLLALPLMVLAAPVWSQQAGDDWEKVVFHLDDTANARWSLMLARSYLEDSPKAQIVFVAYGPGIDFLLDEAQDGRGNPYDHRVHTLMERGVEFRVCAATLGARNVAREDLLEGVAVVPSGIAEIARLQLKEGYAYLKP